ncbi:MAG TPA: hypothetical protein PKC03_10030 [Dokdonella sp.]|jgi:hypothetical protein|nr:hypothetical protein [Dokdonella sp.]
MSPTPSRSRRLLGCALATLAYLATTALSVWLLKGVIADAPASLRALVSLLPVIPIAFAIREVLRLVRASDELQRRIDLEALATAALVVGLAGLSLGFLVSAQVFEIKGSTVLVWMFPALSVTYVLARIRAQRHYR